VSFSTIAPPPPCGTYIITDYDANSYNSVQIGTQCWMKENMKATHYSDGSGLLDGTGVVNIEGNYSTKYWFVYNNNIANKATYGLLYTWAAAMNGSASTIANPSGVQGICPSGWHIPSAGEWTQLVTFLGGPTAAGGKLKETGTSHWVSPNSGATNSSGFTALPGGYRNYYGPYSGLAADGDWWTATESSLSSAWYRYLNYNVSNIYGDHISEDYAFSVRCLRDN
jgi:uncharacterized protein (TIGR02145 family)